MKSNSNQWKGLIPWVLYDLAASSNTTIIQTFLFAAYFVRRVADHPTEGATLWGLALGLAGFFAALAGPILGAFADRGGGRKKWLAGFTFFCIFSIALMWFIKPSVHYVWFALVLAGLSALTSECAYIFYNAMLPDVAPPGRIGLWSGWGWAAGYVGGVLCLSFCYLAFIQSPSPWIKLNVATAADVRASFLFAAIWFFIFALPLFLFFAEESTPQKKKYLYVTRDAFEQVRRSFREIGRHVSIVRFLVARMIFTDALITLFAFGGIYATAQFGMTEQEILIFGIVLNISAGVGAAFFAFLDDLLGGKTMILISLLGLFISSIIALSASTRFLFWIGAIAVGGFVGPVQASSRSYLARVAPLRLRNQMFGFFALSSKVTAFLGPLSVSWITYLTNSLRVGMFSILIFLVIGFFLMLYVEKDTGCF